MNATDLYEIVKYVPREAWPDGVRYDWNQHGPKRAMYWHVADTRLEDRHAELLFEASMARWLDGGCCHRTKSGWCYHDNHSAFGDDGVSNLSFADKTRVGALAAACKVKP